MAVSQITAPRVYVGLAADDKPTSVPIGSTFYASDSGLTYTTYDGTNWVIQRNANTNARTFARRNRAPNRE